MKDFNTGDIVQLKSGGRTMTVEGLSAATNRVACVWFDENNKLVRERFLASTLVNVNEVTAG